MNSQMGMHSEQELQAELNKLESILQDDVEAALELVGERLADWEKIVMHNRDYATALRIGGLLEKVRHLWLSLSWYQWVVSAWQEHPDSEFLMRALRAKGRVYIRLRMYAQALPLLQQVEAGLRRTDSADPTLLPYLLQNISIVYGELGQHGSALEYAQRALDLLKSEEDIRTISMLEGMIGSYLASLGRFEEAFHYLTRSRAGLERCKDDLELARSWHNYAELMRDWGRMEEAIAAWRMALEIKKRTGDSLGQVNTLISISDYFIGQKEWHAALRYINQAFPLCHQHRLFDKEVHCLEIWSVILFALGRYSDLEVVATRATYLRDCVTTDTEITELLHKVSEYFAQAGL